MTFYCRKSAVDAQNALHNIKTLPGVSNLYAVILLVNWWAESFIFFLCYFPIKSMGKNNANSCLVKLTELGGTCIPSIFLEYISQDYSSILFFCDNLYI